MFCSFYSTNLWCFLWEGWFFFRYGFEDDGSVLEIREVLLCFDDGPMIGWVYGVAFLLVSILFWVASIGPLANFLFWWVHVWLPFFWLCSSCLHAEWIDLFCAGLVDADALWCFSAMVMRHIVSAVGSVHLGCGCELWASPWVLCWIFCGWIGVSLWIVFLSCDGCFCILVCCVGLTPSLVFNHPTLTYIVLKKLFKPIKFFLRLDFLYICMYNFK